MTYFWRAKCCETSVYVSRKLADIDLAPEDQCACGKCEWAREIPRLDSGRKGYLLEGHGWHDQEYGKLKPNR